jgi:hypothetical protein
MPGEEAEVGGDGLGDHGGCSLPPSAAGITDLPH